VSASDWILGAQTIIVGVSAWAALRAAHAAERAVKTADEARTREQLIDRIRDDEERLDRIADQIARVSVSAADARQGRAPTELFHGDRMRLQALLAPLPVSPTMAAAQELAEKTQAREATPELAARALLEVSDWSKDMRRLRAEVRGGNVGETEAAETGRD